MRFHTKATRLKHVSEPIYTGLAAAAFIFFVIGIFCRAWFLDYSDQDSGVMDDHFINAIVAKNIANGNGWGTTGFETYPLNPESLSTGPALMLPASVAIKIFGNHLSAPGLGAALVHTSLLILVITLICRYYNGNKKKSSQMILGLLIVSGCFMPHYWYRLIGEITAILLTFSAVLILAKHSQDNYSSPSSKFFNLPVAGLLLGMAIATKHTMIMCFLGVLILLLADVFFIKKNRSTPPAFAVIGFLVLGFLPMLTFQIYQAHILGSLDQEWVAGSKLFQEAAFKQASGIFRLQQNLSSIDVFQQHLMITLISASKNAASFFNGSHLHSYALFCWLGSLILASVGSVALWRQTPLAAYLIAAIFFLCLWFFLIANAGLARYITIAVFFAYLSLIALIIDYRPGLSNTLVLTVIFTVIFLSSGSPKNSRSSDGNPVKQSAPQPAFLFITTSLPSSPSRYYLAAQEASNFINNRPLPRKVYASGMWSTNLFEYSSPDTNIFTNLSDIFVDYFVFDEASYLAEYPEVSTFIAQGKYTSGFDHYRWLPVKKGAYSFDLKTKQVVIGKQSGRGYQAKIKFQGFLEDNNTLYFFVETKNFPAMEDQKKPFCGKSAFENDYFLITVCTQTELGDTLKQFTSIGFRPMKWMRPRLVYPEDFRFF